MNYPRLWSNLFVEKRQPVSLIHFVTERCNARCRHCFVDFDHAIGTEQELSTEEIVRLTKTLGDALFSVYLTGGEPFLRKDLFAIVAAYGQHTAVRSINVATNGMYTDAVRGFIDRYRASGLGQRLMFSISIDDVGERHDANRRVPGLYARALATYRLIAAHDDPRIIPTVAITVTPYNCDVIVDLYRSLRASGVRSFIPILMREQGVVQVVAHKQRVLAAHAELVRLVESDQAAGTTIGTGTDLLGCYVNARNQVFNRILPDIYLKRRTRVDCTAGTLFGVVFPNGDVCPCEVQRSFVLGNLRDHDMDFQALWRGREARAVYHRMREQGCACTFDGAWAINILARPVFLPRLALYVARNLWRLRRTGLSPVGRGSRGCGGE
jgi:MoaA/NifB/PqqE/SkfB family radical SAM enzyme